MYASIMRAEARQTISKAVYKSIRLRPQNTKEAFKISERYKLGKIPASVLAARGFKADQELYNFLQPSLKEGMPDPSGLKNLDAACSLISEVIKSKRSIAICCDFDVDGLSGAAQLHHFLNGLGAANQVFVPDRFEDGYGLNERMIRLIADGKFALMVCIDYGTHNIAELSLARELGIKSVVVDHHHIGSAAPPCDVFINPHQSECRFADGLLCASGLTWYLLAGLKRCLPAAGEIDLKSYLDLACLGTICDMVPLRGANRVIAKRGLEMLAKSSRSGIIAMKEAAGLTFTRCSDVSFGIGPRLNAAGRMVHAQVVIDLLTTANDSLAKKISQKLNRFNADRQETEKNVKDKAVYLVNALEKLPHGIVVYDPTFHTGVVGIVAQRLVETFYRPAIVLGMDEEGIYKGSVRGIKGFNVVDSLTSLKEYFIKFGGHEGAGGVSVASNQVENLAAAFDEECRKRLAGGEIEPYVEADTTVYIKELDLNLVNELRSFAPFGVGNPSPVLCLNGLTVRDLRVLKNTHLKVVFSSGGASLNGFLWRQTHHPELFQGNKVNIAIRAEDNSYNGVRDVQANIQAVERA